MNIYDISEKAGVSIATVSRVLNGNSKVSDKTRKKILAVMEETGYQPNVFARGLGLNTMNTVGVMCADSSDMVLASAVYHVEQVLHKYQYFCVSSLPEALLISLVSFFCLSLCLIYAYMAYYQLLFTRISFQ